MSSETELIQVLIVALQPVSEMRDCSKAIARHSDLDNQWQLKRKRLESHTNKIHRMIFVKIVGGVEYLNQLCGLYLDVVVGTQICLLRWST